MIAFEMSTIVWQFEHSLAVLIDIWARSDGGLDKSGGDEDDKAIPFTVHCSKIFEEGNI